MKLMAYAAALWHPWVLVVWFGAGAVGAAVILGIDGRPAPAMPIFSAPSVARPRIVPPPSIHQQGWLPAAFGPPPAYGMLPTWAHTNIQRPHRLYIQEP